ncbi:MAG: Clp1/GlmU family protein [Candidatus Eremiobacteraeota bacterium]|nr:Clp1/GlmU family protein [Candidatus Eremiobacteraeota bacterium]
MSDELFQGKKGRVVEVWSMEFIVPAEWYIIPERVKKYRTAVVLGGTDSGKSTFVRFLSSELAKEGIPVGIVDLDVGQSDIGPPATFGLALPRAPFRSYGDLPVESLFFLGTKTPWGNTLRGVAGAARLSALSAARGTRCIVINTTGWIYGRSAKVYKQAKLEMLNPGLIVAFQRDRELDPVLLPYRHVTATEVLILPVSPHIKVRSMEMRMRTRAEKFSRYLEGSRACTLRLSSLALAGAHRDELSCEDLLGRIVGLHDKERNCLGIGVFLGTRGDGTIAVQAHGDHVSRLALLHVGRARLEEENLLAMGILRPQ